MNQDEWSLHSSYSPDLVPSDFRLLGPMKDAFLGRRFADTTTTWNTACLKTSDALSEFYAAGIERLTRNLEK